MLSRTMHVLSALALLGAGCDASSSSGRDAQAMLPDSGVATAADSGTVAAGDSGVADSGMLTVSDSGVADSGMVTASDSGSPDSGMAGGVRWAAAYAQFQLRCSGCHSTMTLGGHDIAHADEVEAYRESQRPATSCGAAKTVAACAQQRVRDGTMPPGGRLPVIEGDTFLLEVGRWIAAGQPGP